MAYLSNRAQVSMVYVLFQKRVQVFYQGFQTREN